ncbi:MAG: type 3 dihydrofolate reductase [Gammaproteobacteria bacterium]
MRISLIAAMDENRVIGRNNALPWRLPADMRHFREVTMGKPLLMGRKTFESIGKPLPGRRNIILTRDTDYHAPGCEVAHTIEAALAAAADSEELMVLGGADLFAQLLPRAARLYLTEIHACFSGDAWFPAFDTGEWVETDRSNHAADEKNPYAYSFVTWDRRQWP